MGDARVWLEEGTIKLLKLMYITNIPQMAQIADNAGIDMVWVDVEQKDKEARQAGLNAVLSNHSLEDIAKLKPILKKAKLLVRINHWHSESPTEIELAIKYGADIIMLPYYKTLAEVEAFAACVHGRAQTMLLLETKEAIGILDETLLIAGIDEIYIGLRDLQLSLHDDFMFEAVANGLVEKICGKIKASGKPYGFGGVARLGEGLVSAEMVISEHYRLGSSRAILSRTFCHPGVKPDWFIVEKQFKKDLQDLRDYEAIINRREPAVFAESHEAFQKTVCEVAAVLRRRKTQELIDRI